MCDVDGSPHHTSCTLCSTMAAITIHVSAEGAIHARLVRLKHNPPCIEMLCAPKRSSLSCLPLQILHKWRETESCREVSGVSFTGSTALHLTAFAGAQLQYDEDMPDQLVDMI
jgi:hypothetical protein